MIASEAVITKKKLKIKFGSQRFEAVLGSQTCEQQSHVENRGYSSFGTESNQLVMSKSHRLSGGEKMVTSELSKKKSSMLATNKRQAEEVIEVVKGKRRKMDRGVTHQCSVILKSLMNHPAGWIFKQPVDPVKLNIPDYFLIISKPMDLGTVKTRLDRNFYSGTEEFVADVRLTFSNAMIYNPTENNVHKMALELNNLFDMKWKSLEKKWSSEGPRVGLGKILSTKMMEVNDSKQNCPKTPPLQNTLSSRKSKTSEEKAVRSSYCARAADVVPLKPTQDMSSKLVLKNLHNGTKGGGRVACDIVNAKPSLSPVSCKSCGKCGSATCGCNLPSDSTRASSDITSERSLGADRACSTDDSKPDCQVKSTSTSQMSKSDPDFFDGSVDDGNLCPSSKLTPPATVSASTEEWATPLLDVQMSPTKALRAAMIKSRFAVTILKAQQRTLLDHGDKADPVKLQQEKERLERRQREERARIEAQIRAAEAASQIKAEIELKKHREKEREAARVELQKMERTVEIEHNLEILKELETLTGCCLSPHLINGTKIHSENPLEQIGLFMKNDYLVEDEDEETLDLNGDGEGDIFS